MSILRFVRLARAAAFAAVAGFIASSAAAQVPTCSGSSCNGQDATVTGCDSGAVALGPAVTLRAFFHRLGEVRQWFSPLCGTRWARFDVEEGSPSVNVTLGVDEPSGSAAERSLMSKVTAKSLAGASFQSGMLFENPFRRPTAACAALADAGGLALLTTACTRETYFPSTLPAVPAALEVPAGQQLVKQALGAGVQIYACAQNANGDFVWTFRFPSADLLDASGRQKGTHFAGPTWQWQDGSQVAAAAVGNVPVDGTAVPWLLLRAVSNAGTGVLSNVSYIQRLSTIAGKAPAAGTCDASRQGAEARVEYTAVYNFYAPVE